MSELDDAIRDFADVYTNDPTPSVFEFGTVTEVLPYSPTAPRRTTDGRPYVVVSLHGSENPAAYDVDSYANPQEGDQVLVLIHRYYPIIVAHIGGFPHFS